MFAQPALTQRLRPCNLQLRYFRLSHHNGRYPHLSEFHVSADDPNQADPTSEQILLQVDKPQSNHNGGTLEFGPQDGYLYISIGDGGGENDNDLGHVEDWYEANGGGNGQDVEQNLLGNILRIDVDGAAPYGIPDDNPFVGTAGLDEIYAYGLRNPYRFSFDMGGEQMLISQDAGQYLWEEVNVIVNGGNYGWNVKEATHCFDAENPLEPPDSCPDTVGAGHPREGDPLIDPVIEFRNSGAPDGGLGLVVVGGYVYRGSELPELAGRYIFGTWSTEHETPNGLVFVAEPQAAGLWPFDELFITNTPENKLGHYLLGFGQDREGEVYVLTSDTQGPTGHTGKVYQLTAPAPTAVSLGSVHTVSSTSRATMTLALLTLTSALGLVLVRRRWSST